MKLTKKQEIYRKMLLRQIHLSPRYINFYKDEKEEWRSFLMGKFAVNTSARLSISNLEELLRYMSFKSLDIQPTIELLDKASKKQCELLRGIWSEWARDISDEALLRFIGKKWKKFYIKLEYIPKAEIRTYIAVIKGFKK